jgi:hypothetical protein
MQPSSHTQIHIPLVAWPVAIMTNLGTTRQLTLSTDTIAKIFAKQDHTLE